jgi:hypothetical protein
MKSDQVMKMKLEIDGNEYEGLTAVDEYSLEYGTEEVPGRDKTVPVSNGVLKIPPIPTTYKIDRNGTTYNFLKDWFFEKEVHDVIAILTDGGGNEYAREIWEKCELSRFSSGAYDAANPGYARKMVTFLPEDIIPIEAG